MKTHSKKFLFLGLAFLLAFALWTWLIQVVDLRSVGVEGTDIGFSSINVRFHSLTGVSMPLYVITDWLGLVPIFVCFTFGGVGLVQLIKRKNLLKVDFDIIILGIYYSIVILCYLVFEMIPINYRPVLINGSMEASYPSSTTLLVLCVMPTLCFQVSHRIKNTVAVKLINIASMTFSVFMVVGRLVSGVHWLTDIVGSVLLSVGLFCVYKGIATVKIKGETYGIQ